MFRSTQSNLEGYIDCVTGNVISCAARKKNQETYDQMNASWSNGTFVAIDGDVVLVASCKTDLNAKIAFPSPCM